MTPEQALALIDRALASVQADRASHAALAAAMDVVRAALTPKQNG